MPHVAFVPFTGLRVREPEMLALGMTLPGLRTRAEALSGLPALGLLTLAGMTPDHWTCSYHPTSETESLVEDVRQTNPDLVAVSALTASILESYEFCDSMNQLRIPTVIGGLHATVLPEEAARHATSVCVKDGESSWLQILDDCETNSLKRIYSPAKPFDLANSPLPRFDLLDCNGKRKPQRWTVQTQRGCPWACEFCGASRLLGPARFKPTQNLAQEFAAIHQHDATPWIELADDNTLAGRTDPLELLQTIGEANIKYFTESDWRVGEDPAIVKALAESGCVQILIGVESLTFKYPGMGRKLPELERVAVAIEALQDAGIVVNGCFIVGADGETDASLDTMAEFMLKSSLAELQVTLQTPFPGTGLYKRLKKSNRILSARDWSYYTLFDVVFQPDTMNVAQLETGFRRLMKNVFSVEASAKRASLRRRTWSRHPSSQSHRLPKPDRME
ncbi:MAG: radical SAM superfamily enzyme YgiQ (UPF0313 family) [Mariniblastus sp.]|jgi:radical SAM superfamily enzyme YgiQ (UPF0313 family)